MEKEGNEKIEKEKPTPPFVGKSQAINATGGGGKV